MRRNWRKRGRSVFDIKVVWSRFTFCSFQKLECIESESSKNISLMKGSIEKLESAEKDKADVVKELEKAYLKVAEAEKNYNFELESNRQMAHILTQKEIELNEVARLWCCFSKLCHGVCFRIKMFCKTLRKKYYKAKR